jgi:hypothetical protein
MLVWKGTTAQSSPTARQAQAKPSQSKVPAAFWRSIADANYTILNSGGLTEAGDEILEQRGVIPRTLDYVFSVINKRQQPVRVCVVAMRLNVIDTSSQGVCEFICKCSYLEIYRENITDLLNPSAHRLQIREDMQKGVYVEDLTEEVVESAADALRILQFGASHRHVARTGFMNHQSSRSHSVFTLYIQSKTIKEGGAVAMKYSRLHVIDLAGSERQKRTDTSGDRLKEAGNINKSLLILGNVIRALVDVANGKEHVHVQYRDSKLTFLLKVHFRSLYSACISPQLTRQVFIRIPWEATVRLQ